MDGLDEFEELEREFSNVLTNPSKRVLSGNSKMHGSQAQNLFQLLTENENIQGVELLNKRVTSKGGRDWSKIAPITLFGLVFVGGIISILFLLYSSMRHDNPADIGLTIGISLFTIPFLLFGVALLGIGFEGFISPVRHEQMLTSTWLDSNRGLIIIMKDVYDVEGDFFHDSKLMSSVYYTSSDTIRIYSQRPYSDFDSGVSRPGGRSVCICKDGDMSSSVAVLAQYSFAHKGPAKQLAIDYSEELGIPFLGEVKTR
tara:strand:- start:109 stop:879 length:771 start_codon:yes stop_codon:yes gene_type:complete